MLTAEAVYGAQASYHSCSQPQFQKRCMPKAVAMDSPNLATTVRELDENA